MSKSRKRTKQPAKAKQEPSETLTNAKQADAAGPKFDAKDGKWKPRRLIAGKGLALHVMPGQEIDGKVTTGGKWWRFRYRYGGREKMLSLGTYPDVSLKAAREKRDEARTLVANGIDPSAKRRAERAARADTFEAVALEWIAAGCPARSPRRKGPLGAGTVSQIRKRLEREVFPRLRSRPVSQIDGKELQGIVKRIEDSGRSETARRVSNYLSRVFLFAVRTHRASHNPADDIAWTLGPSNTQHFAAVTKPAEVANLLRKIDAYHGQPCVVAALKMAAYVFPRSSELRLARWSEIDLGRAEWIIPAERMKRRRGDDEPEPHYIPLPRQAVAILKELHRYTGRGDLVFAGLRPSRPISENTINTALRAMDYASDVHTTHGFRTMASTLLNEAEENPDLIEIQLAHMGKDNVRKVYNRAQWLKPRRLMMQRYANKLDQLRKGGATVTPIRKAR